MPIYEYQCGVCGHQMEAFQKMTDAPLTECPACKSNTLHKLVSAAGFQLKGTGWYATDFRNKGKPETTKTEDNHAQPKTQDSGDSGTKSETSTDTGTKADKT